MSARDIVQVWRNRQATGSGASNPPSSPTDGALLPDGSRIYAEAYGVTLSAGAGVNVAVRAWRNGARAYLESDGGNVTGGEVRWWVSNPETGAWHLGGVSEALVTGAPRVASTDQFVTVGAT
jgi:hypothetical protein